MIRPPSAFDVRVQPLGSADGHWHAPGLAALLAAASADGVPTGWPPDVAAADFLAPLERLRARLDTDRRAWIALAGERPVGVIHAVLVMWPAPGGRADIASPLVDAAWRGRGLATRLLERALADLRDDGCDAALLTLPACPAAWPDALARRGWTCLGPGTAGLATTARHLWRAMTDDATGPASTHGATPAEAQSSFVRNAISVCQQAGSGSAAGSVR